MCLRCQLLLLTLQKWIKQTSASWNRFSIDHFFSTTTWGNSVSCSSSLRVTLCYFSTQHTGWSAPLYTQLGRQWAYLGPLAPRTHQPHRSGSEREGNVLMSSSLRYTLTVNKKRNKKSSQSRTDNLLLHLSRQANKLLTEKIILTLKVIVATVALWTYSLLFYGQNKNVWLTDNSRRKGRESGL